MKKILFLGSIVTLLTTTGCLVEDGGPHEHARFERHREVMVEPAVVVRPPEIIVR